MQAIFLDGARSLVLYLTYQHGRTAVLMASKGEAQNFLLEKRKSPCNAGSNVVKYIDESRIFGGKTLCIWNGINTFWPSLRSCCPS